MTEPAWRASVPAPEALTLVLERVRTALSAMQSAPPMDGGGTYEQRRDHAAAQHLEFEIAPAVDALDVDALVQTIARAAVEQYILLVTPGQASRGAMPITSTKPCPPGLRFEVIARPQTSAMRVDRLVIPNTLAPDFLIHDIRIGNNSQLVQADAIPGDVFAPDADDAGVDFETIQTSMDFALTVEYTGTNPDGEVFRAVAMGETSDTSTPEQIIRERLAFAARRQAQRDAPRSETPPQPLQPLPLGQAPAPFEGNQQLMAAWQSIVGATPGTDPDDDELDGLEEIET